MFHLDTDFLVFALATAGPERRRLLELATAGETIEVSAVAWFEFCRGPRTPEQIATARAFLEDGNVVAFSDDLAESAADVFRQLGSPRRRAADVAIGVTAAARGATLVSRNARDFAGIPGLAVEEAGPG